MVGSGFQAALFSDTGNHKNRTGATDSAKLIEIGCNRKSSETAEYDLISPDSGVKLHCP